MISSLTLWQRALLEVAVAGLAAGFVGVHIVLRRLEFLTVALAHATFPGVVVAYWIGVAPLAGALGFGWLMVWLLAVLHRVRQVDTNSSIGVLLAGCLGLGVLLQGVQNRPSIDLAGLLTGHLATVSTTDVTTGVVVAVVVIAVVLALHKELILGAFDPGHAASQGYGRWLDAVLLLAVAAVVITTLPAMGTILAVALPVVPAMTARLWSDRIGPTTVIAASLGAGSGVLGLVIADRLAISAGATIALTTGAAFVLSWVVAPHGIVRSRR